MIASAMGNPASWRDGGFRTFADGDPDSEADPERTRIDADVVERRAMLARPRDAHGLTQLRSNFGFSAKKSSS
jgi:hypothetical protein